MNLHGEQKASIPTEIITLLVRLYGNEDSISKEMTPPLVTSGFLVETGSEETVTMETIPATLQVSLYIWMKTEVKIQTMSMEVKACDFQGNKDTVPMELKNIVSMEA